MLLPQSDQYKNYKRTSLAYFPRSRRGSALIVGLAALFLIVVGSVLSVLLLLNTGIATFNKEKVGFVASQAATYAATFSSFLSNTSMRNTNVTDMVNGLLTCMGLNSSNTVVTVSDTTLNGKAAVTVSITATLSTITAGGFGSIIPQQIQSSSTAVKVKDPYASQYIVGIDPFGGKVTGAQISPIGQLPNDGQPAWAITITGVSKIR